MKVYDLSVGMLVYASGMWNARIVNSESKSDIVLGYPVTAGKKDKSIMMYLGYRRGEFAIHGSKKHHVFLFDNKIALMSGYEVRYLETLEEWER
jgi:hypothetical protein